MIGLDERYPDLLADRLDPRTDRLVRDLDMLFGATAPPEMRASVSQAMNRRTPVYRSPGRSLPITLGLPAVAAVLALLAGALLLGLQSHPPNSVSAQTILQRAASMALPSNRVIHRVYRSTYPGTVIRDDFWEETGAHGHIIRSAEAHVERTNGTVTSIMRSVDNGRVERDYEFLPLSMVVRHQTFTHAQLRKLVAQANGLWNVLNVFNGPGVAKKLTALSHRAPQGVHLLGLRHFAGALVYAIHFDQKLQEHGQNWPSITFYFDAHTYILRGIVGPPHQFVGVTVPRMVLVTNETLRDSAVPPHTFDFRLPKGVLVLP